MENFMQDFHLLDSNSCQGIEGKVKKLRGSFKNRNFAIIADWDRTLTCTRSSSWMLPGDSGLFAEEYVGKRNEDYKKYRPYELGKGEKTEEDINFSSKDLRIKYADIWWKEHMQSMVEHGEGGEDKLRRIVGEMGLMNFREGVDDFLKLLHKNEIPLVIISAGLGNLIYDFLEYKKIPTDFISVETNMLCFDENGNISGFEADHIVHSANKGMIPLKEKSKKLLLGKKDFLILGDGKDDIDVKDLEVVKSADGTVLSIGILTDEGERSLFENTGFDIVNNNICYTPILQMIRYICFDK